MEYIRREALDKEQHIVNYRERVALNEHEAALKQIRDEKEQAIGTIRLVELQQANKDQEIAHLHRSLCGEEERVASGAKREQLQAAEVIQSLELSQANQSVVQNQLHKHMRNEKEQMQEAESRAAQNLMAENRFLVNELRMHKNCNAKSEEEFVEHRTLPEELKSHQFEHTHCWEARQRWYETVLTEEQLMIRDSRCETQNANAFAQNLEIQSRAMSRNIQCLKAEMVSMNSKTRNSRNRVAFGGGESPNLGDKHPSAHNQGGKPKRKGKGNSSPNDRSNQRSGKGPDEPDDDPSDDDDGDDDF